MNKYVKIEFKLGVTRLDKVRGIVMTLVIAMATIMGSKFPIIGSAIFAIIFGIIINNVFLIPKNMKQVSNLAVRKYCIIVS